MDSLRGIAKGGWHPKGKDGGKESWRGDFKGIDQVAGWMGKGKKSSAEERSEHISRPLTTLKDPSLFGPPPKNVNYHGGAALPNEITPHREGLGAPLRPDQLASSRHAELQYEQEEQPEEKPAGPPLPYRADRTGLRTDNLPPPPVHRAIQATAPTPAPPTPKRGPPPMLPSRQSTTSPPLATSATPPPGPPPAYQAVDPPARTSTTSILNQTNLNQSAISRLSNAGVSVPALGIGSKSSNANPWQNERSQGSNTVPPPVAPRVQSPSIIATTNTTSPPPTSRFQSSTQPSQLSELQARFARMTSSNDTTTNTTSPTTTTNTTSPTTTTNTTSPTTATPQPTTSTDPTGLVQPQAQPQPQSQSQPTWQAQSASLQKLHNNPENLSTQDLRNASVAAQNANAFRARHQETINAAGTRANDLNRKYNVTGRIGSFLERHASQDGGQGQQAQLAQPQQQQIQQQLQQGQGQVTGGGGGAGATGGGPIQMLDNTSSNDVSASISRKPPPPPPPKKPASMHVPPPVPMGTRPSFT